MKRSNLSSAALLIGIVAFAVPGCKKNPIEPEIAPNPRTYSFQVRNSSSAPIAGATTSIRTRGRVYSEKTDQRGSVSITVENDVVLPDFVVVTVDHSSIMPEAVTVPGDHSCSASRTVTCVQSSGHILVKEVQLHHLGDDNYDGSANSKLQMLSEGTRISFQFNLTTVPTSMPLFRVFARGVQCGTKIKINGIQVSSFNNSAVSGDLTLFEGRLGGTPSTCLKKGLNTLELETGYDSSIRNYDDIEFCSMALHQ